MNKKDIIEQFHRVYYDEENRSPVLNNTRWMGTQVVKCPLDLWVYQEIMFEIKPRLIVETGTLHGGSALWFAMMMEIIHNGTGDYETLSIDIKAMPGRPFHDSLHYLTGSSVSGEILKRVEVFASKIKPVLVVLDSDHRANHVYQELEAYSKFVTPGSYMIVEDTNIGGHPVLAGWGKGPMEAIMSWLPNHPEFEIDKGREKFGLTMNPNGYLRRKA